MVIYGQDSDAMSWGMGLFGEDPSLYNGYYGDVIRTEYYNGDHYDISDCSHVENDEIIARTLQEDFSRLAISEEEEARGYGGEEQLRSSGDADEWNYNMNSRNFYSEREHSHEELDDMVPSTSCSSPGDGEENSYSPDLSDEYELDGEFSERLNQFQLIPIPHVPKINGEIPSIDEATSDHERLLNRLQAFGFFEVKVQGDGNCQFRALSDQLYHTPDSHKLVRRQIVNQLKSQPKIYEEYVPMVYGEYLRNMSRSGEWGDHVTLQAAADAYGVRILVMTSFKDTYYIEILPNNEKAKGVICLSFWAEVHYNSIYFQGDATSSESKKKKRWWNFRNKH